MTYYEEDSPEQWAARVKKDVADANPIKDFLDKTPEEVRHEEMMEMLGGIFVQLSRIYDVLITDSDNQSDLDDRHSAGGLFASPPTLNEDAWNV